MGSFSWIKADKIESGDNVLIGSPFKFLIPKEFGGGYIEDNYQDYGRLGTTENGEPKYDMYELLAFWHKADGLKFDGEYPQLKEIDKYTRENRVKGIEIECYDKDMMKLKYPLKLVSIDFQGSYEDLESHSLNDPNQGLYWDNDIIEGDYCDDEDYHDY